MAHLGSVYPMVHFLKNKETPDVSMENLRLPGSLCDICRCFIQLLGFFGGRSDLTTLHYFEPQECM